MVAAAGVEVDGEGAAGHADCADDDGSVAAFLLAAAPIFESLS